jgi:O-antigen ligase
MIGLSQTAWALLCAFVFSIPWEKSVAAGSGSTAARLIGILAFAAGALDVLRRRSARRPNFVLLAAGLFVAWASLTWFWSVDRHATVGRVGTLAQLLGMAWLIWEECRSPKRQMQLLQAYVCGAVTASANAFWRYGHGAQTYYRRYAASGFDPNDFGLVLAISVPIGLYLSLRMRGAWRALWLAAVAVNLAAMVLTASRAGLVATGIGLTFVLWTWREADWGQRIGCAVLVLGLVLSLVRVAPAPQRQRLATVTREATQGTFHGRTRIWRSGLKALKQHPILGVGAGAYPEAVSPWLGRSTVPGFQYVAHNTFLSVLVECGPMGFALYAAMLLGAVLFLWTMPSAERALWGCVLAAWMAGVFTLTWEHYKPSWLIVALIMTEWGLTYRRADEPR